MKQTLTPSDLSRSTPEREQIWDNLWRRTSIGRPAVAITPSGKKIDAVKERYDFEIQDPDCLPVKLVPGWREALLNALVGIRAAQEMPGDFYPAISVPRPVHHSAQGITDIFGVVVESQPDGNEYCYPLKPDPGAIRAIVPKPLALSSYWQAVEWTRYARQTTGGLLPFRMAVMAGPIDMATLILGPTVFLEWIYTEPDTVHSLLVKITNVIIGMLNALKEAAGGFTCSHHFRCGRGGFDVASEVRSLISKEMYADFEAPYLRRIGEACGDYGIHACGNWERTVENVLTDPHLVAMNGQSKENDIATLCRLADGKLLLSINSSANLHERFLWKTRKEFLRYVIETVPSGQPFETCIAEEELPFWLDCYRKIRGKPFDLPAPMCC